jgi:UDP-glucose 4-epimerase
MRRAVVTGAAGFIGSHITERLLEDDFHVLALDSVERSKARNLEHLLSRGHLEYVQGSVDDPDLLSGVFSGVDYVFDYAAVPFARTDLENGIPYFVANASATLNVLQAAKENAVKKVVYASSSAVYGNDPALPKHEAMAPVPISPYATTKLVSELYCRAYEQTFSVKTVCLRYFNVFGPRQSPDSQLASVIPRFIKRVAEGTSPIIFGDGSQTRDFVFVRDVAAANLLAAESGATGVYNIGTGEATSLNGVARLILSLMGRSDIEVIYKKEREGEIKHSVADISRALSFGYRPRFTLETGLRETVEYWTSRGWTSEKAV